MIFIVKFLNILSFYILNTYSADCEKLKMPSDEEWTTWLNNI